MKKKPARRIRKKKVIGKPLEIFVTVGPHPTLQDVEQAIEKKLATRATDLFRNSNTVAIVTQDEGNYKRAKRTE